MSQDTPPALLRADGLTVARRRHVLVRGLGLELGSGEVVHLAGPNGCGKSSLLRVLAGVVEPRRGRVWQRAPCAFVPERLALPERCAWRAGCASAAPARHGSRPSSTAVAASCPRDSFSRSRTPDNGISLGLVAACGITLAQAGALALAARSLERWRG